MDSMVAIWQVMADRPDLASQLRLHQLNRFIFFCATLKREIITAQPVNIYKDISLPPEHLSDSFRAFLSESLHMGDDVVTWLWSSLNLLIWNEDHIAELHEDPLELFHKYGLRYGIGTPSSIWPLSLLMFS
ncbi:hypothetical protein PsYK624_122640 [Phanerochaete sordida]|uniref:Uncharacterized protein n=1 Tax=Phanerochaete sordida TaxID=48140 RepID=A0A9P3LI07_9APHY|nr:hypothetical protein PsYK624_122640 [Phanerochaete sordida]